MVLAFRSAPSPSRGKTPARNTRPLVWATWTPCNSVGEVGVESGWALVQLVQLAHFLHTIGKTPSSHVGVRNRPIGPIGSMDEPDVHTMFTKMGSSTPLRQHVQGSVTRDRDSHHLDPVDDTPVHLSEISGQATHRWPSLARHDGPECGVQFLRCGLAV